MYNEVKQGYTYELNKKFEENKEKLIESFIEYYGKEFEDRIMNIYSDTNIVYYVGQNITDLVNTYNIFEYELTDQEKKILEMERGLSESSGLTEEQKNQIRYLGSNKINTFTDEELEQITNTLITVTKTNTPKKMLWRYKGKTNRFIFLPAYIWEDSMIIHEMNHNVTSDVLFIVETEDEERDISISGLNIDGTKNSENERIIEELINEKSTIEITDIFHSKGGTYVEKSERKNIIGESSYRKSFYLIDKFYNQFKDEIKNARMTGSKNLLLETCGKENYYKLVSLVNKYYNTEPTVEKINKIDKVYNSMVSYQRKVEDEERI